MPTEVVVIGAGLAGLVCARELNKAGMKVTVLEAQNRPGGRIHTLRSFADGMYSEAGAMGFLDIHAGMSQLVSELGLTANQFKDERAPTVYYLGDLRALELPGRVATGIPGLTPEEERLGVQGMWQKYVGDPSKQLGDPTAPDWSPLPFAALDNITAREFLLDQGATVAAAKLINRGLTGLYGDGIDSFSALMLLLGAALLVNATADFEVNGGNDNIPRALAATMLESIQYGAQVTGVEQSCDRVTVKYKKLRAEYSMEADYAVCAIPFPRLAKIPFAPELPLLAREMTSTVGNTSVTRVYFQTRSRFWQEQIPPVGPVLPVPSELALRQQQVFSGYNQPGVRGILESYMSGFTARDADAIDESEQVQDALQTILQTFTDARPEFESAQTYSWQKNRWAMGAYAYFRPGQFTRYWEVLTAPAGRVHFCGDQTSVWVGWMEGALESGLRAASEIVSATKPSNQGGLSVAAGGRSA